MKLINTDGMTFFGPGSEWFWSMLQLVVVAVSLIGLYRQVRLQSSAGASEQLDSFGREFESERYLRYQLDVLLALRADPDPTHIPEGAAGRLANYWEKVGNLSRGGHLDRRLLWEYNGVMCEVWWATLAPFIRNARKDLGDSTINEHFEWIAGEMAAMSRRVGAPSVAEASLPNMLEPRIAACQDLLRIEETLRSVVVSTPDSGQPVAGQPAG